MKLQVITHSGQEKIIEVLTYDAAELNEKINNPEFNTVLIGDVIFSRIDIKLVAPVVEETPQSAE